MSNWRRLHDLANAQPSPTAAAFWLFCARVRRQSWPVYWLEAVSRATPEAARGTERSEYRTGEDGGRSRTLDADGGQRAYRQGGGQGQRPPRLPPQPVGQEPTRGASRRGLPKRSAEGSPAGDRSTRSRQILCHQKETPPKRGCGCCYRSSSNDGRG